MRILSIDPGFNTGIAIINLFPCKLRELCTVPQAQIEFQLSLFEPDVVIVEREPELGGASQSTLVHDILRKCEELAPVAKIVLITPGEWKPVVKAKEWRQVNATDQHQKDAYLMARFYIFKSLNQDIGELNK